MKLPGPDHPITITPHEGRVVVMLGDTILADTTGALELREASYKPVFYIPRSDANLAHFARTAQTTHCPYKGDANYFDLNAGGKREENAVWTYETPFPAMREIASHLAFYPNKVTIRTE